MPDIDMPMPQTLQELEQLVQKLYLPGSPQTITSIQAQLQKWQRSEAGWEVAERLLGSGDPNVRFFGALTLTVKLNLDWEKLDTENGPSSEAVLSGLITTIINATNRGEAQFVLRKLCSSLVTYFCKPVSVWSCPLRQLVYSFHEGQYVPESLARNLALTAESLSHVSSLQLSSALWFATDLIEELMKMEYPEQRTFHERLLGSASDIESILSFSLQFGAISGQNGHNMSHSLTISEDDIKIRQTALSCFASWINYYSHEWTSSSEQVSFVSTILPPALLNVYGGLEEAELIFVDLLVECKNVFDSKPAKPIKDLLYDLVLSDWSKNRLALSAKDNTAPVSYQRFVLAFAQLELESLRLDPQSSKSGALFALIHHVSRHSPADEGDEDVVLYALEFWSAYVEDVVDEMVASGSETPQWLAPAFGEINQAIHELLDKVVFPPSEVTSDWDTDTKRTFQAFRQDFGDMLESSYMFLGEGLTKALIDATQQQLSAGAWLQLEASIYCLNKLADAICEKVEDEKTPEDEMLYSLFCSSLFSELSSNTAVPRKLLKTCMDMLACFASLFRRHVNLLPSALTFLFSSLQIPPLANDSARSISSLCSSCRLELVSEVPAFINQYGMFRNTPAADVFTKEKVTGGISAIIQAVNSREAQVSYVSELLAFIEEDIKRMVELVASHEIEKGLVYAQAAMESLAGMGKGLQSPDDAFIGTPQSSSETSVAVWSHIQQRIIRCIDVATQVLAEDSDLMEQACNVLRAGYKETQHGPFVLPAGATVAFVSRANLRTARLPVILATAHTFVKHHIDRLQPEFTESARILLHHVLSLTREMGDPSQDPEVAQSLIELLGAYTQDHMAVLKAELGPDLEYAFHFTIAALRSQDILPKRSSTSFWAGLLTVCTSGKPEDQVLAREILQYFVSDLCEALVFQISGDAPHSAIEYIVVPFVKLIGVQKNFKQTIDQCLSRRYGSDTIGGARPRFLQAIMSAKGNMARKVVSTFWHACRRHTMAAPLTGTGSPANPQVID